MKHKIKKVFENAVWWSGVVMVGLVLGISLQFVRAWTEPTDAPPGGNVGAPINTGIIGQAKQGVLQVLGLTVYNNPAVSGDVTGKVLTAQNANGVVAWAGGTPIGAIMPYAGSTAPAGFFLCDGASYSRAAYASLAAVIGGGGENFQVPDLKGKTIVGYSSTESEFNALGKTGGEKTHTLTIPEMPAHTHYTSITIATPGQGSENDIFHARVEGNGVPTLSTGGSGSHNNLQPYLTLNYIIKY